MKVCVRNYRVDRLNDAEDYHLKMLKNNSVL